MWTDWIHWLLSIGLEELILIVLPLIMGIGIDDGVHVVHDFRRSRGRYRTSASTVNAVLITSLTTMVGFGSLMIGRTPEHEHPQERDRIA